MPYSKIKVIISGGGTGGHIFPAIAIANELKKKISDVEILFVGAKGRMEMEKVPAAGYLIEGLWISGLQRRLTLKNLSFPFKVILSLMKAKRIIKQFKPDVVVGVGGYASGPTLRVATSMKIPTVIQEQNSYPGITNKVLAPKVSKICVAYSGMEKYFPKDKIYLTGNPIRQDIVILEGKYEDAMRFFDLSESQKTLLVIGGSLGATTINKSVKKILPILAENNIQLIWQTGKSFYNEAEEAVRSFNKNNFKVFDFITKMDFAYSVADFVVSRAGAIAVSELCIVKKPCILIPSPNVAEDHQTKNAMALVNLNAALLVKDIDAEQTLGAELVKLFADINLQNKLRENIAKLAIENASEQIVDLLIGLVKK